MRACRPPTCQRSSSPNKPGRARSLEPVIDAHLVELAYETRLATLRSAGVGPWDVIESASRSGSLDASIRNSRPNPLRDLLVSLPALRAIAFNGLRAAEIGRRALGSSAQMQILALPSGSPANTAAMENKRREWGRIRHFPGWQGGVCPTEPTQRR